MFYKITCIADDENRWQYSYEFQGKRYRALYLSEAVAKHKAEGLRWEIGEDGSCSPSPIDYKVEKTTLDDFAKRDQYIEILCQQCGSPINDDLLPFPLLSDLESLPRQECIVPDDWAHDPGCESIFLKRLDRPFPPDDPDID